jgi:CubicO group peptidase (beta-lactamase class C family)
MKPPLESARLHGRSRIDDIVKGATMDFGNHGRWLLVGLALLAGCASAPRAEPDIADGVITREMQTQRVPGVAVAVVQRGKVLKAVGFGSANLEHAVPVTRSTLFQSGSLGKQFAAVALMLQVENGTLALDDSITRFFPAAPASWKPITVRHLLTHTSGIPDYDERTLDYRKDYTEDELARVAFGLPLEFPAGARWNYSNTGYVLLGILIGKASGQFYGDVLRDRVFAPLGMKTARIISEDDILMHRAAGYRLAAGAVKNQEWVAPKLNTTADGSLYLSLDDWLLWEQALRQRAILKPASWEQIFTPVQLNSGRTFPHGFGWALHDGRGPATYRHSGAWQGFKTVYLHMIEADLTVIVLCNLAEADPERMADRIAQVYLPALKRPAPTAITDPDPELAARVRALIEATASGQLQEAAFEHLRAGFFPQEPAGYRKLLQGLGPVLSVELLERFTLGDETVVDYRAWVGTQRFRVQLTVSPSGRFSSYALRPEPSED